MGYLRRLSRPPRTPLTPCVPLSVPLDVPLGQTRLPKDHLYFCTVWFESMSYCLTFHVIKRTFLGHFGLVYLFWAPFWAQSSKVKEGLTVLLIHQFNNNSTLSACKLFIHIEPIYKIYLKKHGKKLPEKR